MKSLLCAFFISGLALAAKPEASGPVKAFSGPEGEVITMVEVNNSKEMLVHFKGIGGELEGKSKLYKFEDKGRQGKDVYWEVKVRKSKPPEPRFILVNEQNQWTFYNPTKSGHTFKLHFSQEKTDKTKLEDVLNAYQP